MQIKGFRINQKRKVAVICNGWQKQNLRLHLNPSYKVHNHPQLIEKIIPKANAYENKKKLLLNKFNIKSTVCDPRKKIIKSLHKNYYSFRSSSEDKIKDKILNLVSQDPIFVIMNPYQQQYSKNPYQKILNNHSQHCKELINFSNRRSSQITLKDLVDNKKNLQEQQKNFCLNGKLLQPYRIIQMQLKKRPQNLLKNQEYKEIFIMSPKIKSSSGPRYNLNSTMYKSSQLKKRENSTMRMQKSVHQLKGWEQNNETNEFFTSFI